MNGWKARINRLCHGADEESFPLCKELFLCDRREAAIADLTVNRRRDGRIEDFQFDLTQELFGRIER